MKIQQVSPVRFVLTGLFGGMEGDLTQNDQGGWILTLTIKGFPTHKAALTFLVEQLLIGADWDDLKTDGDIRVEEQTLIQGVIRRVQALQKRREEVTPPRPFEQLLDTLRRIKLQ